MTRDPALRRGWRTSDNRDVAITNPHPLLSDEVRRRVEDLARQENREPSAVLEEAVRRYAASSRLERLSERLEKSAHRRGIKEEDVPSLVADVRRENELRGR
jgi:predicted transcriptional regulator